jgi:hypothetical protein
MTIGLISFGLPALFRPAANGGLFRPFIHRPKGYLIPRAIRLALRQRVILPVSSHRTRTRSLSEAQAIITPVVAPFPRRRTAVPRSNGCAAMAERLWKDGLAECTMDITCRISGLDVRVESAPRPVTHPAPSKGRPLKLGTPRATGFSQQVRAAQLFFGCSCCFSASQFEFLCALTFPWTWSQTAAPVMSGKCCGEAI